MAPTNREFHGNRRAATCEICLIGLLLSGLVTAVSPAGQSPAVGAEASLSDRSKPEKAGAGSHVVSKGDVVKTILISGELAAERSRELFCPRIRSAFSSTVTFMAEEGSPVQAGDRILEFDSSDLVSSRAEAERKLDEAKLLIQKTTADLAAQRSDLLNEVAQAEGSLKIAQLYGQIPRELLPANDFQRYQMDLERANLALEKARERLQRHDESVPSRLGLVEVQRAQAELELRKIEGDLESLQVNAPQNGIVIYGDNWRENRKMQVGDAVFPGMTVMTLPDLSSMQIIGYIYDTELRYLRTGMPCSFGLDAVPGNTWTGKLLSVTSVAGRKSFASEHKVFKAIIQLDSQDTDVMRPGMTARVEIPVTVASDVLIVPRPYLGLDSQERYFVVTAGDARQFSPEYVEVGAHGEWMVEVTSGLKGGEVLDSVSSLGESSK